jgi:two-component system, cell cycle sensor histidine kinase and response regulator CckA
MGTESRRVTRILAPAALVVVALALLGWGVWFYRIQEQELRHGVESELESIARLKVQLISAWRQERLDDAALLMDRLALIADAKSWLQGPTAETARETLRRFHSLRQHFRYRDILLVDPDGKLRLSLLDYAGIYHAGAAEAMATVLRDRKPVFTDLHTEADNPTPHIGVVAPIFSNNGTPPRLLGAFILVSDAREFLYPLIQSWPVPSSTAETILVRRDGDDLLFLNDLRHREDTGLELRIPLSRTDLIETQAILWRQRVLQGRTIAGSRCWRC